MRLNGISYNDFRDYEGKVWTLYVEFPFMIVFMNLENMFSKLDEDFHMHQRHSKFDSKL